MSAAHYTHYIAQSNMTCILCNKTIRKGYPYAFLNHRVVRVIRLERVHPKCLEKRYG